MAAAEGRSPLERLALSQPAAEGEPGAETMCGSEGRYSQYDAIREQLAASRARSYAQDRQGCCAKAASYLDATRAMGAASPAQELSQRDDEADAKAAWLARQGEAAWRR